MLLSVLAHMMLLFTQATALAQASTIRPTALFGDHMVLQATDPSKPGESAHIAGQ